MKKEIEVNLLNKFLSDGYHWIVRYKDGTIMASQSKPYKPRGFSKWYSSDDNSKNLMLLPGWFQAYSDELKNAFPSVRWEDEEPTSIAELLLKLLEEEHAKRDRVGQGG